MCGGGGGGVVPLYNGQRKERVFIIVFSSLYVCEVHCMHSPGHPLSGPGHAKTCLMTYVNNKGADQPAHPRSLISAFVVRCLDSIIHVLAISKISSL